MHVVIFKAKVDELDDAYQEAIAEMKQLAFEEYGCLQFDSMNQGDDRIALSYWESEAAIQNWKKNSKHLNAQQSGRDKWYKSYSVEVAEINRSYRFDGN